MKKLTFATFFVISGLIGLIFAVGLAVFESQGWHGPVFFAIAGGFGVALVLIQFLISPWIFDRVADINWTAPESLGMDFALWLKKTCESYRIPVPRFGVIEDGAPNAFTYGNGAFNARVVVSRGLTHTLEPEEFKAVVAHELGHIRHRDFIVMTAVQALVVTLYVLYRASLDRKRTDTILVAIGAFLAYQAGYYLSLLVSRLREYMADYASAQIMQDPNLLSSALIKIAWGLGNTQPTGASQQSQAYAYAGMNSYSWAEVERVRQNPTDEAAIRAALAAGQPNAQAKQQQAELKEKTQRFRAATGAIGIAAMVNARAAVSWTGQTGTADPALFMTAARWELFNPWARLAELVSTHPLSALRIKALTEFAQRMHLPVKYDFRKVMPAQYGLFWADLFVASLMVLGGLIGLGLALLMPTGAPLPSKIAVVVMGLNIGALLKNLLTYPGGFQPRKVLQLLGTVVVSPVRPVPVVLRGRFTGQLDAQFFWANDFILQDETGFVPCLYRQPLGILEVLFGMTTADRLVGAEVEVRGWYRRFQAPYVEIDKITMARSGDKIRCWYRWGGIFLNLTLIGLGVLMLSTGG